MSMTFPYFFNKEDPSDDNVLYKQMMIFVDSGWVFIWGAFFSGNIKLDIPDKTELADISYY